jgi:hypothetical protein
MFIRVATLLTSDQVRLHSYKGVSRLYLKGLRCFCCCSCTAALLLLQLLLLLQGLFQEQRKRNNKRKSEYDFAERPPQAGTDSHMTCKAFFFPAYEIFFFVSKDQTNF